MHTKYTFGRSNWRTFDQGYEKEWLLTNGLGGFSCATVTGNTARIHAGYLVASLRPPVDRVNVLSKIQEKITAGDRTFDLACQEFVGDKTQGFRYLEQFSMDIVPTYCYQTDQKYGGSMLYRQRSNRTCHGQSYPAVFHASHGQSKFHSGYCQFQFFCIRQNYAC